MKSGLVTSHGFPGLGIIPIGVKMRASCKSINMFLTNNLVWKAAPGFLAGIFIAIN
jgi:hypothetical protein